MAINFDRDQLVEAFGYLDKLRKSGRTNMWAAGAFVERELGHDSRVANELTGAWMKSFNGTSSPEQRADSVLAKSTPASMERSDVG